MGRLKAEKGIGRLDMTVGDLKELVARTKKLIVGNGQGIYHRSKEQLWGAIGAVFMSGHGAAPFVPQMNGFDDNWGTAVNVQAMVSATAA
jgi:phosphoenolpyruvate synthase/pyruvate phosphate dikinase